MTCGAAAFCRIQAPARRVQPAPEFCAFTARLKSKGRPDIQVQTISVALNKGLHRYAASSRALGKRPSEDRRSWNLHIESAGIICERFGLGHHSQLAIEIGDSPSLQN